MSGEGYVYPRGFASKFYAYRLGNQVIPSGIVTRVQLNTLLFDTLNEFDQVATYMFTPRQAGYYWINAQIHFPLLAAGTKQYLYIRLTGLLVVEDWKIHDGISPIENRASWFGYLLPTDTIYVETWQNSGAGQNLIGSWQQTYLQAFRVA